MHLQQELVDERPTEAQLGIDIRVYRELRNLILDESVEIHKLPQCTPEKASDWDSESLGEYGSWLCLLLEISPEEQDKPLSVIQIERAATLGLGPYRRTIEAVLPGGVTELQENIGFMARNRYQDWSRSYTIAKGRHIADRMNRRLTRSEMDAAHKRGEFMSGLQIIHRFDSIQNFQEMIGRPTVRGWSREDHGEWGAAIKRQNGIETRITSPMIRKFAAQGKGPNYRALTKHFVSLEELNRVAEEEYWAQIDLEEQDKEFLRAEAKIIIDANERLRDSVHELDDADLLRTMAHYRIVERLADGAQLHNIVEVSLRQNTDSVVRWLLNHDKKLTIASIEATASLMRVFGILWPMYRFQGVDLSLESIGL